MRAPFSIKRQKSCMYSSRLQILCSLVFYHVFCVKSMKNRKINPQSQQFTTECLKVFDKLKCKQIENYSGGFRNCVGAWQSYLRTEKKEASSEQRRLEQERFKCRIDCGTVFRRKRIFSESAFDRVCGTLDLAEIPIRKPAVSRGAFRIA